VNARKKREALRHILTTDNVNTAIVFANRKTTVRELNKSLQHHGFRTGEIHGDMDQSARLAELALFKEGKINILCASDVAARGLDIKGVSHVVNFDCPWHPDDYVHRVGRTGRAGAKGRAFTLIAPEDAEALANVEKLTGNKLPKFDMTVEADASDDAETPARPARSRKRSEPRDEAVAEKPRSRRRDAEPREERWRPEPGVEAGPAEPRKAGTRRADGPRDDRRRRDHDSEPVAPGVWNGPVPDFLAHSAVV